MKPKTIIASATVLTLCSIYLVRLNESAESFASTPSTGSDMVSTTPIEAMTMTTDVSSSNLNEALKGLKTKKSIVTIDNRQPCNVYGEKGTVLYLPANLFEDESGRPYKGSVRIVLEECYDISDMLAAKLSTTSDGRLLETAGMVNIEAYGGNKPLRLRTDQKFNIYFPKNEDERNDFSLFYGEWKENDIINWKLAENDEPISEELISTYDVKEKSIVRNLRYTDADEAMESTTDMDMDEMEFRETASQSDADPERRLSEDDNCFLHIAKSYLRRGTRISEMDYFNWKLANGQTLNQWFVSNFNPDLSMLEDFCLNGLRSQITFHVNEDGTFRDYYISKTSITEYDRRIADFLRTMPALDLDQLMPEYVVDHACVLTFGTARENSQEGFVQQFKSIHKGDPDKPLTNVEASLLDFFVYSSSQLGWINCDRFYEEGERVDYEVMTSSPECSMSMVFEDINSVLKGIPEGDKVVFTNIPTNRKIRIVGIRSRDQAAEMSVVASNTSSKQIEMNDFQPVGINAIQAEFKEKER